MSKLSSEDIIIGVVVAEVTREDEENKKQEGYNRNDSYYEDEYEEDYDFYNAMNRLPRYSDNFEGKKSIDI